MDINLTDLERQRAAAQHCLRLRRECGLAYAPIIVFRHQNGTLTITAADSLRAAALPVDAILEFVDQE